MPFNLSTTVSSVTRHPQAAMSYPVLFIKPNHITLHLQWPGGNPTTGTVLLASLYKHFGQASRQDHLNLSASIRKQMLSGTTDILSRGEVR